MIPKASQRGSGQDLATHLLNGYDNEQVEIADLRGAVADDLHGAFAEWQLQADALTRCQNYLYSLSINPDPRYGPMSRAQYDDYITRVEETLGLSGQPRAVVFHVKNGREHCHVVWSRIDLDKERAIHQPFDRHKLMMVTRQFARDHSIVLPEGMDHGADRAARPKSLYDRWLEQDSGLSKEDRILEITHAWRASDSPRAFVNALGDLGYVLATGNRPYVLVDAYGGVNALPRMIDDRTIRTKDIRAFLAHDYPPDSLPDVEEARQQIAEHRKAIEAFALAQARAEREGELKEKQQARRDALQQERRDLHHRQARDLASLRHRQAVARADLKQEFLAGMRALRRERQKNKPTGLAAFLGRVTGVNLIMKKLHRYRDRQRHADFFARKAALLRRQAEQSDTLAQRHQMQLIEMNRRIRALDKVEKRELRSLEAARRRDARTTARRGHEHMPAIALELRPRGRRDVAYKAKNRHTSEAAQWLKSKPTKDRQHEKEKARSLTEKFLEAARKGRKDDGRGDGSEGQLVPRGLDRENKNSRDYGRSGRGRARRRRSGDGGEG
ncbi:MAG: relaxase/mobilization nuclease domain-containing protein [Pararhodobacter sp.]|nr:relaxase/mobilization nuclease domain-containing protein [Pararhodobacter sp.]